MRRNDGPAFNALTMVSNRSCSTGSRSFFPFLASAITKQHVVVVDGEQGLTECRSFAEARRRRDRRTLCPVQARGGWVLRRCGRARFRGRPQNRAALAGTLARRPVVQAAGPAQAVPELPETAVQEAQTRHAAPGPKPCVSQLASVVQTVQVELGGAVPPFRAQKLASPVVR